MMRDWFSTNLGDAMLASEPLAHIESLLLSAYERAGNPIDMAAFVRHESDGRLHCEVKIYLSPGSVDIAKEMNAKPCSKPSAEGLGMLVGAEDSWKVLFPEQHP